MSNRDGFTIDYERLREICLKAYRAFEEGNGRFRNWQKLLPQFTLPEDLEYSPRRTETKEPSKAGNYLFIMATMEKMSLSKQNIQSGLRTWGNPKMRWIFNPEEVIKRTEEEIEYVTKNGLRYNIHKFSKVLLHNSNKIVSEYDGLAKNIIEGQTVEEARKKLMEFKGVGSGISNLFITYCAQREIAKVTDLDETRLKVDIHKARIPLNTEAVIILGQSVRRDFIVPALEETYLKICKEEGLDSHILDSALWIIGSEICTKKDFGQCVKYCPLEKICKSCVVEDKITGRFLVYDKEGKRIDSRRRLQLLIDLE